MTPTEQYFHQFMRPQELSISRSFLEQGYVILPTDDRDALDRIRSTLVHASAEQLGISAPKDQEHFLNRIGDHVPVPKLNEFRLAVFNKVNSLPWVRAAYFATARRTLEILIGNELAMQKRINLSIQLPDDDSSLLPLHSDCWNGDSPFEVVLWIPFVDVARTKSMFILPPEPHARALENMAQFAERSAEEFYHSVERDLTWLELPYGSVLVFTHTLMHGNRINREGDARWSTNCRFKSVFSPYWDKQIGEFFEPITLRPVSRLGMDYKLPGGFHE